jgi:hypothetical protein
MDFKAVMDLCARTAVAVAALFILAFNLAACGDNEAAERKAFIEFLQTRIIDKPGVHVPTLTPDLESKLGRYAKHYGVINVFNSDMNQALSGAPQMISRAATALRSTSMTDIVNKREDIAKIPGLIANLRADLGQKLAAAEAAKANLSQPEDLKVVFEAAFERDVRSPALSFQKELPLAESAIQSILKLVDFVIAHRDRISVQGSMLSTDDPKIRSDLNALLEDVNKKSQLSQDAQNRMNKLVRGS